jgi:hypothetical protein
MLDFLTNGHAVHIRRLEASHLEFDLGYEKSTAVASILYNMIVVLRTEHISILAYHRVF